MVSKTIRLLSIFLCLSAASAFSREIQTEQEASRLGDQAALSGNVKIAEDYYRRASELAPKLAMPAVRLGEILYAQSRYREASEAFENAARLKQDLATKKFVNRIIKKMSEMKDLLGQIEKVRGGADSTLLDRLHAEAAKRASAGGAFMSLVGPHLDQLLMRDADNIETLYFLAEGHFASSQPAKAIDYYRRLSRLLPGNARLCERLGDVCVNVGSYDEARFAYKKAVRAAVRDGDAAQIRSLRKTIKALPVFSRQIDALIEAEEYEQAFRELRKFLARNPSHPWAVVQMGRIYEKIGRLAKAESLYLQAIQWRYEDPNAHYALGQFYLFKKKKFEKALEEFMIFRATLKDSAIFMKDDAERKRLDGYLRDAARSIVYMYIEILRQPKKAEIELEALVKKEGAEARDFYSLGVVYLKNKKRASAYQAFRRVIEMDPKSDAAKDAEEVIGTLRIASREGFEV